MNAMQLVQYISTSGALLLLVFLVDFYRTNRLRGLEFSVILIPQIIWVLHFILFYFVRYIDLNILDLHTTFGLNLLFTSWSALLRLHLIVTSLASIFLVGKYDIKIKEKVRSLWNGFLSS